MTFVEKYILFWLFALFVVGIGWVMNIIDLLGMSLDPLTPLAVLRVVGIFIPPLGAVLGYFF